MPRPSDMSFYNWETQTCTCNATPNFQVCIYNLDYVLFIEGNGGLFNVVFFFAQVIADNETGILFKNKRDRKIINVDPKVNMSAHL